MYLFTDLKVRGMVGAPLYEIKGDTALGFTANTLLGEHGQVRAPFYTTHA